MLDKIKRLLGISDNTSDELLTDLLEQSKNQLYILTNEKETPNELEFIVTEVTIKRYNRLGNEGMTNYSQEGQAMTFALSDFDEYDRFLSKWLLNNDKVGTKGFKML